jgi:hypothetical protein
MINNTNYKMCYYFYYNNSFTLSTYNNDVSYSKYRVEKLSKNTNTKVSCEFLQESIISCLDMISFPTIKTNRKKNRAENLVLPCVKIFLRIFCLIWIRFISLIVSPFLNCMSNRKDHLSHQ